MDFDKLALFKTTHARNVGSRKNKGEINESYEFPRNKRQYLQLRKLAEALGKIQPSNHKAMRCY